jgi:hypothetical protein
LLIFAAVHKVVLHDLQPKEFMDQVAAVGEVLDFKEMPEDQRVSLVATKLIDEDLSVDWASPPIL